MPSRSPGALAVLLHRRQPCAREIVCDTDGLLVQLLARLAGRPGGGGVLGRVADDPPGSDRAAYVWLRDWRAEHGGEVERRPGLLRREVWPGWWVWGLSNWIGGGWCAVTRAMASNGQIPFAASNVGAGGQGVQAQRTAPHEKRPHVQNHGGGGYGVQAQRGGVQAQRGPDKRPHGRRPIAAPVGTACKRNASRTTGQPNTSSPATFSTARAGRPGSPRWRSAWSAWSC